jgi:hypothetical protein
VSLVDFVYSSLAREVSERCTSRSAQSLHHREPFFLLYCYATHNVVPESNCSDRHLQAAPGSTIVTMWYPHTLLSKARNMHSWPTRRVTWLDCGIVSTTVKLIRTAHRSITKATLDARQVDVGRGIGVIYICRSTSQAQPPEKHTPAFYVVRPICTAYVVLEPCKNVSISTLPHIAQSELAL